MFDKVFPVSSVFLIGMSVFSLGCDSSSGTWEHWSTPADSTSVRTLVESPSACSDCISIERAAVLGDLTGEGYVQWTESVIRDDSGNYWVGQRGWIKVFDSQGSFLRQVGRRGEGPMEFSIPAPVHVDGENRVHVLDVGNRRETIIRPDFGFADDRTIPGIVQSPAPIPGSERYAVNMWLPTAEQIGMPLHIIEGPEILHSFGIPEDGSAGPQDSFGARRKVTTDAAGYVFSAKWYDYLIEVWTETGQRITGFEGPSLNEIEVGTGPWSPNHHPPSRINAIRIDESGKLWVASMVGKDGWTDMVEERVDANGEVGYVLYEGIEHELFTGRIDVIDLDSASIIATKHETPLVTGFVDDSSVFEVQYLEAGIPQIVVWNLTIDL